MTDLYEKSVEETERFLGGEYRSLEHLERTEWWGFKNGYVQGYRAAQAEMRKALGVER